MVARDDLHSQQRAITSAGLHGKPCNCHYTRCPRWRLVKRTRVGAQKTDRGGAARSMETDAKRSPGSGALPAVRGEPGGGQPPPLVEVRPQEGVKRHTVVHFIDVPFVQILDVPVAQMGNQVVELMQTLDTATPEQVIEVPKLSQDRIPQRSAVRRPQKAEQLVKLPTVLSFSSLQQQSAEQIIDIPAPRRRRRGQGGLQCLRPEQSSTASLSSAERISERIVEQIVDVPFSGGGLHVFPDPGGSSSSTVSHDERGEGFFRTFPRVKKKSEVSRHSPSPRVPARSSSWTPAAYAGGQVADEYDEHFECNGALWKQAWDYQHQCYCWCEVRREDGHCFLPFFSAALGVPPALSLTWSRSGTLSCPCELGAARVQVHGLVHSVRDGVLLRDPQR